MIKDEREKGWFWIENTLIDRNDLEPLEKLLYMTLARYANNEGKCFPSQETLLKVTGLKDKRTIIKYISNLEKKKLLKIEKNKGRSNIYKLLNVSSKVHTPDVLGTSNVPTLDDTQPDTSHAETSDMKCTSKEMVKETKEGIYNKKTKNETYQTKEIENLWREKGLRDFEYPPVEDINKAIKEFSLVKVYQAIERISKSNYWKSRVGIGTFFKSDNNFEWIRDTLNGDRDDFKSQEAGTVSQSTNVSYDDLKNTFN